MRAPPGAFPALRGTGSFSLRWVAGPLMRAEVSGADSAVVASLNENQIWRSFGPSSQPRLNMAKTAFLLGSALGDLLATRRKVCRVWVAGLSGRARGKRAPTGGLPEHLQLREGIRGLLGAGVNVEIDLEDYAANATKVDLSTVFAQVLDPLERCGVDMVWPQDQQRRDQLSRALLWGDRGDATISESAVDDLLRSAEGSPRRNERGSPPQEEEESLETRVMEREGDPFGPHPLPGAAQDPS